MRSRHKMVKEEKPPVYVDVDVLKIETDKLRHNDIWCVEYRGERYQIQWLDISTIQVLKEIKE